MLEVILLALLCLRRLARLLVIFILYIEYISLWRSGSAVDCSSIGHLFESGWGEVLWVIISLRIYSSEKPS